MENTRRGIITTIYLPEEHREMLIRLKEDQELSMSKVMRNLIEDEFTKRFEDEVIEEEV